MRKAHAQNKLLNVLKWLINCGEACKPFDCPEKDAAMIASRLMKELRGLKDWVAEADAEMAETPADESTPASGNLMSEKIEIDPDDLRRRQLLEIIMPIEHVLMDAPQAERVLTGNRLLDANEQIRWVAILKLTAESVETRNFSMNDAITKAQAAERASLMALAQDPVRLAVLHRSTMQFEEAVQARLRRLKGTR